MQNGFLLIQWHGSIDQPFLLQAKPPTCPFMRLSRSCPLHLAWPSSAALRLKVFLQTTTFSTVFSILKCPSRRSCQRFRRSSNLQRFSNLHLVSFTPGSELVHQVRQLTRWIRIIARWNSPIRPIQCSRRSTGLLTRPSDFSLNRYQKQNHSQTFPFLLTLGAAV